jgi:hypothetical protein
MRTAARNVVRDNAFSVRPPRVVSSLQTAAESIRTLTPSSLKPTSKKPGEIPSSDTGKKKSPNPSLADRAKVFEDEVIKKGDISRSISPSGIQVEGFHTTLPV